MKLQIDTKAKSIKIENDIKLSVLISNLKKMFPNNEWKDFTLVTNTIIEHWSSPIVIKEYPVYPTYPRWPWYGGTYYASSKDQSLYMTAEKSNTADYSLKSGVYNVDLSIK